MIEQTIKWIDIREQIPPKDKIILGYFPCLNGGLDIVRTCYGISEKERKELENKNDKRAYIYDFADEFGNNLVPYRFDRICGQGDYWGQQILCWAYIEIPKEYENIDFTFNGNTELGEMGAMVGNNM